jgi:hypothetical protein
VANPRCLTRDRSGVEVRRSARRLLAVTIAPVLAKSGDMGDNQIGPRLPQFVVAQPKLGEWPEILDEDISVADQPQNQIRRFGMFKIERD